MVEQTMRPYWKADTYCLPLHNGVYLRGNSDRLFLKGKSLYPLLQYLIPHLNGNVTLEEITRGLDADRKRMVVNLIEKLITHHFLTDKNQDQPDMSHSLEQEDHAPNLAFIQSFQSFGSTRFEAFRHKRLLIIGDGANCDALVQAGLRSGLQHISIMLASERDQLRSSVWSNYDASTEGVRVIASPPWDNEAQLNALFQAYDAILHCAYYPQLARAQLVNRVCIEKGKILIQAVMNNGVAWIGPLVCPEMHTCWECAWRRLQANVFDADLLARSDSSFEVERRVPVALDAELIANHLLFELFRYFTQIDSTETGGKMKVMDLNTYESEIHPFVKHPLCQACQSPVPQTSEQFLQRVLGLQHQSPMDPQDLLEKFFRYVDAKTGLFPSVENSHFVRLPLAVYAANLPNLQHDTDPLTVIGASIDTRKASIRAAQKACECYAANCVDRRRLLSLDVVNNADFPVISVEQLVGSCMCSSKEKMWTWAMDTQTQHVVLVPATQVFSSLCKHECGLGSGSTWDEAVCQALTDWCSSYTIEHVQNTYQSYPQIDLASSCQTPEGAYLYRLLKSIDRHVTVYDVTGPLHVPTFAVCLDEKTISYSSHYDGMQALNRGLEQALQQYQSIKFDQPDYALPPVPDLPVHLRGDHLVVVSPMENSAYKLHKEFILQQLQMNGFRTFVTPLDHDSSLMKMWPYIARVLVSRGERGKEIAL
ncbi:TOMM precursor leader peptide-binding protein [Ktedonospora formicarum]|uniref:YcaO domain-containing protein n=1 Tax=Ktedonospora formicarum TaxID=2778364 RepID=A0A8J3HQU9_9CHLR|nr:TOMM precursor leader peptide-binding protein [Ktedonospora formicarum]GHO41909.1 hypothetical protein KSX_00720 [Ktedonospora formicarum]